MFSLDLGSVLSRSISIWLKNIVSFTILVTIVYSPLIIYTIVTLSGDFGLQDLERLQSVIDSGNYIVNALASAAVIYGVLEQLRGSHASIGACIVVGLKRIFPVLLVSIVASVPAFVVGVITALYGLFGLLFAIPVIIIALMFYVAVPVAVIERPGIIGALKRSRALTAGFRGTIFLILVVAFVVGWGLGILVAMVFLKSITHFTHQFYWILGLSVVVGSFQAVLSAVVYHDLRSIKDGVSVDELVKVFE